MAELIMIAEALHPGSSMEASAAALVLFIKDQINPPELHMRDLRLREGDIILANNGKNLKSGC